MQNTEHQILPHIAVESMGCGPVLVFAAHPADEVFACGGAIMRHVAAGDPVRVVVLTDGNDGTQDEPSDYRLKRQHECRQAAIILGYGEPVFWDISACGLEYGELLIRRLQDSVEQQAAELVYAPSCWEVHSEYCALAMATAEAVRRCPSRVRLVMYEVGVPLHPNLLLNITDLQDRKAAAIACFITQLARQPLGSLVAALNRFRTYTLPVTVQAAEAYRLVTGEQLRNNPLIIQAGAYRPLSECSVEDAYPLVSVIIRSMGRKSLAEALDSVAAQTYPHIEIVVIDAKGQEHPDLPGWWGRFPLRLIQLKSPLPRSRAANVGINHALGEYLIFLDDDDVFYPDHIVALAETLCRSDKPRCAYTGVHVEYYNQGQLVRVTTFNEPFHRMKLWGCNFIPIHAVLFERSLYEQGCCFDENLNIFEDWDFWMQISQVCDFVHIDQISACYRNYGHSGLGDQVDQQLFAKTSACFFDKWKNLWSGEQLSQIIQYRDILANTLRSELGGVQDDLLRHQQILGERNTQLEYQERLLGTQQSQLDTQQGQLGEQERLLGTQQSRLGEQERLIDTLNNQLDEQDLELEHNKQKLEHNKQELEHNVQAIALFELRLSEKDVQLAQSDARAVALQQTIEIIYQSTSWRIMRPLRFVSSALKHLYSRGVNGTRRLIWSMGRLVFKCLPRRLRGSVVDYSYRIFGQLFIGFDDYERWLRIGADALDRSISSSSDFEADLGVVSPVNRYPARQQSRGAHDNRIRSISNSCRCVLFPRRQHDEAQAFSELIGGFERVSFDIFDTLIERITMQPTDVFHIVGHAVSDCFKTHWHFAQARIDAELEVRAQHGENEVTLNEIYDRLLVSYPLRPAQADRLKALEIATELAMLKPKASGKRLYAIARAAGIKISLISDTYLPRAILDRALGQCGYDGCWDRLHISNESRQTKHYGGLFLEMLAAHNIAAAAVLHVGDNLHSDVEQAKAQGIRSFPVIRTLDRYQAGQEQTHRQGVAETLGASLIEGLVAHRYGKIYDRSPSDARFLGNPYFLGYAALGPVLLGFAQWLVARSREQETSAYCFLSRDGYYLKIAYDIVVNCLGETPQSHYLAASRMLCTMATLTRAEKVLDVARIDHRPMPIGQFLTHRFRFSKRQLQMLSPGLFTRHGLKDLDTIVTTLDQGKMRLVESLTRQIMADSRAASERYEKYLRRSGIDFASTPLVDIGYSGTGQKSISQLLSIPTQGLYFITNKRVRKLRRLGLNYDGWLGQEVELDHPFFRYVQNWEMFLSATHGSFIDIDETNLQPISEELIYDAYSLGVLANLRRGALEFVSDFVWSHRDIFLELDLLPGICTQNIVNYFEAPDAEDCAPFGNIVFEDRFGGDVRPLLIHSSESMPISDGLARQSVWPEASVSLGGRGVITAFYPCEPFMAENTGDETAAAAIFLDGVRDAQVSPACFAPNYGRFFDTDGFPSHAHLPVSVSIIIPVWHSEEPLMAVLDSLQGQLTRGWSVVVTRLTDGPMPVCGYRDFPLTIHHLDNLSDITRLATGLDSDWVLLTDGATRFEPSALAEWSAAIDDADIVVGDDDCIDQDGNFSNPHFKPAFSPELLWSTDYFGGAYLVRRDLLANIETTASIPRAWLWEVSLKLTEYPLRVAHVPRILAHRDQRLCREDLASAQEQANIFVADRFAGYGITCQVVSPEWAQIAGKLVCRPEFADEGPAVAILVPTKNQHRVVERCIESLKCTTYRNYHIYLIDNESDDPEAMAYFESIDDEHITLLRIANLPGGFSYSYVNNRAVEQTRDEDYLLFLNNDTEVIEPRWLSQMVGWQGLPGVGSVGALLYYPNDLVQHAGITHRLLWNVLPAPSFKLLERGDRGYQDYVQLARDSAAQTAACLLTPRSIFLSNGMFDEVDFNVAYNDCDYGFKLAQQGLRNVYCPDAVLYHHEGLTRGGGRGNDKPHEEAAFVQKYLGWKDPFYSQNLAQGRTDFAIQPTSPITGEIPALRIAWVTHNLKYEGAPLVLLEIVRGITKNGVMTRSTIISMEEGPLREIYEDLGCEVLIVDAALDLFQGGDAGAQALIAAASLLSSRRIDVVLANTVLCWWAVEAAKSVRIPSLWVIHESEPPFTHLKEHNEDCAIRGRTAMVMPYRVIFVSWATREVFKDFEGMGNFHTVYNGFDFADYDKRIAGKLRQSIRARLGISHHKLMAILPGSVCERKAQLDLVRAIPLLDRAVIGKLQIMIVGDRPSSYSAEIHRQIDQFDPELRACVQVLPHCKQVEDYFLAADILISTARIEAFPKVIQEGMYFGLPMVVAPVFGIVEQLQDEVSALFFEPGDHHKLAIQLARLVNDTRLRTRLGVNARVSLDRFPTVDDMAREYGRILMEAWLSME